jgi:hypothetical protein
MPQDKNKPNQGRGSNDPSQNTGGNSVAEEIDWLILSDLGANDREKSKNSINDPLQNLNDMLSDDQEDIDWLQSIGLDEPVTGIKAHKPSDGDLQNANQQATTSTVGDIDWLIVTDLKTRMGDTDLKLKNQESAPSLPTQTESLDFSLPVFSDEPDDTLPELLEGILAQSDLGLGNLGDFNDLSGSRLRS